MLGVDTEMNKNTSVKQKCSGKGQHTMVSAQIEVQKQVLWEHKEGKLHWSRACRGFTEKATFEICLQGMIQPSLHCS